MSVLAFRRSIPKLAGLWPGAIAPQLFPIAPDMIRQLYTEHSPIDNAESLLLLKERVPEPAFWNIIGCLRMQLRYADNVFPGFRCVYGQFVNDEWLALIDYHKTFHRDHVVHQTQVAVVAQALMKDVKLPSDRRLTTEYYDWCDRTFDDCAAHPRKKVCLLDLAAYVVARGEPQVKYLHHFAAAIGIPPERTRKKTDQAFQFWREVIYDATIVAGLFHDIGYPLSFLREISDSLAKGQFRGLLASNNVDQIWRLFDDPLCLMPFRGYRSARQVALSHTMKDEIDQALSLALQKSHGLPGALTFLYLNDKVMDLRRKDEFARGRLVVEVAALAIVMHDMGKYIYWDKKNGGRKHAPRRPYMRVAFDKDPVSFFVTLADEMQAFGRYNVEFGRKEETYREKMIYNPVIRFKEPVEQVKIDWGNPKNVTITYGFKREHAFARYINDGDKGLPEKQHEIFDPDLGYLDYSTIFDKITVDTEWV